MPAACAGARPWLARPSGRAARHRPSGHQPGQRAARPHRGCEAGGLRHRQGPADAFAHRAGSTRGRLRYMSPEQVRGGPLDGRADLFSLAVLLYEAAVGQGPFSAANDAQLLLAVRDARLAPTDDLRRACGPALADVLLQALRPHPAERYTSADEMARALAAVDGAGESEQPWHVAEVVAETLASEGPAPGAVRERGPFSALLREGLEDEP
ncbi:protein kinase [Myxococcus sp. MxC21-1]|uniref:protein kinase domain-containing protein n=1 Tax=Myxococcus sp. MxC21-1 TaxID=3041439 RepID=UPI00292D739C|nr:protein kinase [Myxococcus sp. MxC21-1]WNZ62479.1 protein kinase [Myxococcus sp. MxC21-1]